MSPDTTETTPNATETSPNTPKGFEDMTKIMEECGCCGMMQKMMDFMQAKCGTANDGEKGAKTGHNAEPEDDAGGKTARI